MSDLSLLHEVCYIKNHKKDNVKAEKQNHDIEKLVKIEQQKITQLQTKIAKVREGFEDALYNLDEAKARVTEFQEAITLKRTGK